VGYYRIISVLKLSLSTPAELRTAYSPEEIATKLFRGPDADERVAETAEAWRVILFKKGFCEPS
jgi:hypothetical protein